MTQKNDNGPIIYSFPDGKRTHYSPEAPEHTMDEPALYIPGGAVGGAVILALAAIGSLLGLSRVSREMQTQIRQPTDVHAPGEESRLKELLEQKRRDDRERLR